MAARLLVRHRVPVLVAVGVLTLALGVVGMGIGFDFSPQKIYAGGDDLVVRAEALKDVFGHTDAVLMVVLEADGDADVLAPPALTWAARLARVAAEEIPDVVDAESLATLELPRPGNGAAGLTPPRPLVDRLPADEADAERVRATLERYPLLEGVLVGRDRRAAAVLVFLRPEAREVELMRLVVGAVEDRIAREPPPAGYRAHLSGLPAIRTNIVRHLEHEQADRLPVATLIVLTLLVLAFRTLCGTLLPLAAVVAGMVWTAGAYVFAGLSLNLISNVLPVFLFTIGMANAVHVVNRYSEECHRTPGDRRAAAVRTIARMALACLLTYLTTAIGFLSLAAARSETLSEVGIQTSIGLALLYASTMFVFAGALAFFRPPAPPVARGAGGRSLGAFLAGCGRSVARRPWISLVTTVALMGAAIAAASGLVVDTRATEMYDADHPMSRTLHLVESKLGGVLTVDASLQAETERAFLDPTVSSKVAAFARFAATQPDVLRARSYVDYHDEVLRRLPEGSTRGAIHIAGAHAACALMGQSLHYEWFLTDDARHARVLMRVPDVGSRRLLALFSTLEGKLAELFPEGSGVDARLSGDAYIFANGMDRFIRDVLVSLLGAAIVIFGVIALLFRSPRFGLISILPNLTPLVLTAGYMGLRGYTLDGSNVIVFAISLGVAVDNTIHLLARFREELRPGVRVPDAIDAALRGAGRAIVLTSILLVLGLSSLHFSEFVPTRRFAELASVTMAAALVGNLCLLPACLVLFGRKLESRVPD
jgi:hydrophobe/amphiphile efflux-3 (HAE3) family protein